MEAYKNLFKEKTESELILLYNQFLESEKNNGIPDNELGKIRDEYCNRQTNGVLMMVMDLTRTLADLWYFRQLNPYGLKLSIGTKVRIRSDLKAAHQYGTHGTAEEMLEYAGKEAIIVAYEQEEDCSPAYLLDIDDRFWSWSDEMFEK